MTQPAWAVRCPISTDTLPAGTLLYHGTDNDNFSEAADQLEGPAWVSRSLEVAKRFATRSGGWGGTPRVVVYRTTDDLLLPVVTGLPELDELAEEFHLGLTGVEEMRESIQLSGLPGWWIPNNYPDGDDILLSQTHALEYMGNHILEKRPATAPENATAEAPSRETLRATRLGQAVRELREVHRLKEGVDFAMTNKYGELHVLSHHVFRDTIKAVLKKHDVSVTTWHGYA